MTPDERPFHMYERVVLSCLFDGNYWSPEELRDTTDASELAVKEAEYRDDIARIDNPDATFIAACDPDTVLELIRLARAAASPLGEEAEHE